MARTRFDRLELKYVIGDAQRAAIAEGLRAAGCLPDANGDAEGRYPISSLYYDNEALDIFWDREREIPSRRRLRIRLYGGSGCAVAPASFLEIKQKYDGRVAKRRVAMTVEEALAACGSGAPTFLDRGAPGASVVREARGIVAQRALVPALLLRYDRQAFRGPEVDSDLRVTFDERIRCRRDDLVPRPDDERFALELLPGLTVMEIKVDQTTPLWLSRLVAGQGVPRQAFSKYSFAVRTTHPELGRDPSLLLPHARRAVARRRSSRAAAPADTALRKVPAWTP